MAHRRDVWGLCLSRDRAGGARDLRPAPPCAASLSIFSHPLSLSSGGKLCFSSETSRRLHRHRTLGALCAVFMVRGWLTGQECGGRKESPDFSVHWEKTDIKCVTCEGGSRLKPAPDPCRRGWFGPIPHLPPWFYNGRRVSVAFFNYFDS